MSHRVSTLVICAFASAMNAFCGSIIVDNDEWTLSNAGFANEGAANGTTYAQNAAKFLTGSASGAKIWIDSDNFGLNGSNLQSALSAYTLTDGGFSAFTLATLQGYQAVFLSGDTLTSAEESALISYVNGGGSVYIAAGTATVAGGAAGEASQWNAFLNSFDLNLATTYNGIGGNIATNSTSAVLSGVSQLYYNNGNTVNSTGANGQIITQTEGQGLIGIYSSSVTSPTPEPATALLIVSGLAGLGLYNIRRRS